MAAFANVSCLRHTKHGFTLFYYYVQLYESMLQKKNLVPHKDYRQQRICRVNNGSPYQRPCHPQDVVQFLSVGHRNLVADPPAAKKPVTGPLHVCSRLNQAEASVLSVMCFEVMLS